MFLYTMTSVVSRDCETQGIMDQNCQSHEWVQTSSTNSVGLVKSKLHTKAMIASAYFVLGVEPAIISFYQFNDVSGTSPCLPAAPLSKLS